jgi:hypothetical protein
MVLARILGELPAEVHRTLNQLGFFVPRTIRFGTPTTASNGVVELSVTSLLGKQPKNEMRS